MSSVTVAAEAKTRGGQAKRWSLYVCSLRLAFGRWFTTVTDPQYVGVTCSEAVSASPELVRDHDQLYTGSWTELPHLTVARLFETTQSRVSSPTFDSVLCPDTDLEVPR
jgi:hypothetical protein